MASPAWRVGLWALLAASAGLLIYSVQILGIDFGPMWAAGRLAASNPLDAYTADLVTRAQPWVLGSVDAPTLRPFAYPPTVLLLFTAFGALPFSWGYALWSTVSLAACFLALRRAGAPLWTLAFAPFVQAVIAGQMTLLVLALILTALMTEGAILAGILFAIAGCLKPQLLCLLPVALIAQRRLDTAIVTGLAAAGLVAVTVLVWGFDLWLRWLSAVGEFQSLLMTKAYIDGVISPFGFLTRAGVDGRWAWLLLPVAAFAVWSAFRSRSDPLVKLLALGAGALLVTPYAMTYDLALLGPALAVGVDKRRPPATGAAYIYAFGFWSLPVAAIIAPLALLLRSGAKPAESAIAQA